MNKAELGTTFSQVQCEYLGLDEGATQNAFKEILPLFRIIRLGSYWDRIERTRGQCDFQELDWFLNEAQKKNQNIILTIGMKAPRHPEFHFPKWVKDAFPDETSGKVNPVDKNPFLAELVLIFEGKVLEHIRGCSNISKIQVENEPLVRVPFAGNKSISLELLKKEVALARELKRPDQRILLNLSINTWPIPLPEYSDETQLKGVLGLADDIAVNVYPKVPLRDFTGIPFNSLLIPPMPIYFWRKVQSIQRRITELCKGDLITEAQAEPWEYGDVVHIQKREYPSSNPQMARDLALRLEKNGFNPILLWGCEHWYWHKQQGHMEWWNEMQKLVERT